MSKLPKFTLAFNDKKDRWDLEKDKTNRTIKSFTTKEKATKGGVLERVIGENGGSVKIEKKTGGYQEERTYPQSKDPVKSKG